uniref:Uncharacterized protein n=1 Tax=Picea glauca TaxID=3330 RepID=A0A117NGE1_PICGL|nr:hypothetical protein ABT39_MTgene1338 [Picea glauca]QHR89505.1 hypothetical protein Q903MT_gene3527 [Picea sitchensis]
MHMAMDLDLQPLDIGLVYCLAGKAFKMFLFFCLSLLLVPSQLDL